MRQLFPTRTLSQTLRIMELTTGHHLMRSRPELLARVLAQAATPGERGAMTRGCPEWEVAALGPA